MTNTRRRFLAFLGLAGAPAAVWAASARAQSTTAWAQSVQCSTDERTATYALRYQNDFLLGDGKLTTPGTPNLGISAAVKKATYSKGFSNAAPANPTPGSFNSDDTIIELNDTDSGPIANLYTHIRTRTPVKEGRLLNHATGDVLCPSLPLTAKPDKPDTYDIAADFVPDHDMAQVPISLALEIDGRPAAVFDFDLGQIDVQAFADRAQAKYLAASGLTYDPAMNYVQQMPECTQPLDPTTGGAAPCFFTTAASLTVGLSDDCWELRTLRRFRDTVLCRTTEGRALTARYYLEAPRLVAGINRRADAARLWLRAYWTYILPCAVLARLGLHRAAVAHYKRLFTRLEALA